MSAALAPSLEALRAGLPDWARDVKLNVAAVLMPGGPLTPSQRWGVAVAAASASRHAGVRLAVEEAAAAEVDARVLEDARAAAASWP